MSIATSRCVGQRTEITLPVVAPTGALSSRGENPFWCEGRRFRILTNMHVRRRYQRCGSRRRGATTLDYVLLMTAILPFVALALPQGRRIVALVYELTCILIASPFM
jgi:hypothetical protein